jgi:hypothetical protein
MPTPTPRPASYLVSFREAGVLLGVDGRRV